MPRPRALLLSPEAPYPLWGGGALRTASVLNYLAGRYALDVVLFREQGAGDPAAALPEGLVEKANVIGLPFHARTLPARLRRNGLRLLRGVPPLWDRFAGFDRDVSNCVEGRRYEVVVIEHLWCAHYERVLRPVAGRIMLNLHNVESALHRRFGAAEGGAARWAHERFARAYERIERHWLPRFDLVLAASEADALSLPSCKAAVYPNTLPHCALPARAAPGTAAGGVLAFSGNMGYHPNVQAVRWFARDIWPRVRRAVPAAEWVLVGKNEHVVRDLVRGAEGVRCTGMVENAVAELARADVAVVPLLSGSGTRLKILEAWAAGTPVVSTRLGAEGLGEWDGLPVTLADNADEFSAKIVRLLCQPDEAAALGVAGRQRFERSFTWESAWKVLAGARL